MPDEINSAFSQALGRYRDALREYVSLYKKATPVDSAKLIQRDREMTRLQQKLAREAEPLGIDWKADVQKALGAGALPVDSLLHVLDPVKPGENLAHRLHLAKYLISHVLRDCGILPQLLLHLEGPPHPLDHPVSALKTLIRTHETYRSVRLRRPTPGRNG